MVAIYQPCRGTYCLHRSQIPVATLPIPVTSIVGHHVPGQLSVEAIFSPCAANYRHTINIKLLPCVRGEDIWLPDDKTSFSRRLVQ